MSDVLVDNLVQRYSRLICCLATQCNRTHWPNWKQVPSVVAESGDLSRLIVSRYLLNLCWKRTEMNSPFEPESSSTMVSLEWFGIGGDTVDHGIQSLNVQQWVNLLSLAGSTMKQMVHSSDLCASITLSSGDGDCFAYGFHSQMFGSLKQKTTVSKRIIQMDGSELKDKVKSSKLIPGHKLQVLERDIMNSSDFESSEFRSWRLDWQDDRISEYISSRATYDKYPEAFERRQRNDHGLMKLHMPLMFFHYKNVKIDQLSQPCCSSTHWFFLGTNLESSEQVLYGAGLNDYGQLGGRFAKQESVKVTPDDIQFGWPELRTVETEDLVSSSTGAGLMTSVTSAAVTSDTAASAELESEEARIRAEKGLPPPGKRSRRKRARPPGSPAQVTSPMSPSSPVTPLVTPPLSPETKQIKFEPDLDVQSLQLETTVEHEFTQTMYEINISQMLRSLKLPDCSISSIVTGMWHSILLLSNGLVLSCGSNSDGQCGLDCREHFTVKTPTSIPFFDWRSEKNNALWKGGRRRIKKVVCGDFHTLCLDTSGNMYSFGNNRRYQLGLGDCRPRFGKPCRIRRPPNVKKMKKRMMDSSVTVFYDAAIHPAWKMVDVFANARFSGSVDTCGNAWIWGDLYNGPDWSEPISIANEDEPELSEMTETEDPVPSSPQMLESSETVSCDDQSPDADLSEDFSEMAKSEDDESEHESGAKKEGQSSDKSDVSDATPVIRDGSMSSLRKCIEREKIRKYPAMFFSAQSWGVGAQRVSVGESHLIVLDGFNRLYSLGSNEFCQTALRYSALYTGVGEFHRMEECAEDLALSLPRKFGDERDDTRSKIVDCFCSNQSTYLRIATFAPKPGSLVQKPKKKKRKRKTKGFQARAAGLAALLGS